MKGNDGSEIMVTMKLNKKNVDFELDTDATVTVMSEQTFRKLFPKLNLDKSSIGLKTYTGEILKVVGHATIKNVHYQKHLSL